MLRRLAQLAPAERAAWTRRFEGLAAAALDAAGPAPALLARVEREHPATAAAARAALGRAERELEAGRSAGAASWLERAATHARLAGAAAELEAVERRERLLARLAAAPERAPDAWERADELVAGEAIELDRRVSGAILPGPRGLVFLDDGRLALQSAGTRALPGIAYVVTASGQAQGFQPWKILAERGLPLPVTIGRGGADWPTLPASDGRALFCVLGRAEDRLPGERLFAGPGDGGPLATRGNLLVCVELAARGELPNLRWALGPFGRVAGGRLAAPTERALGPELWELQPGPLVAGELVLVQARRWPREERDGMLQVRAPGDANSVLLALDARTGAELWRAELGRGTELLPDLGDRLSDRRQVRAPALPLARVGTRAFCATALGSAFLVDLADGRVAWSALSRRRAPESPGWLGGRAPAVVPGAGDGPPTILWAPPDSDHLYRLRGAPDLGAGLFAAAPRPIGEGELCLGGDARETLVLGRAGARRTVASLDVASGARRDSVWLGREERFLPGGLVSDGRVLVASDRGAYLFDRGRELYLLDHLPQPLEGAQDQGGPWARGERVYCLAGGLLFSLRAR